MNRSLRLSLLVALLPAAALQGARAADAAPAAPASAAASGPGRDVSFYVAQRLWITSWDNVLNNAAVVLPSPSSTTPVIQSGAQHIVANLILPVTSFGLRIGRWTLSTSIVPSTKVSNTAVYGGTVSRSENDIGIGYSFSRNWSAALVYKSARISEINSVAAQSLLGASGDEKLWAVLVGLNAMAPIGPNTALTASLAIGPGKGRSPGMPTSNGNYTVGELGVSFRFPDFASNRLSANLGYRFQNVDFTLPTTTVSTTPGVGVIATGSEKGRSTTQGLVFGIGYSF
ncbi:MAG: hypothetical protein KGL43_22960 [Burkholderiales bacterium]|nr:hypothetical protein [Burkholderiales bacterium]